MDSECSEEDFNGKSKTLTRKHLAERQRRARINSYLEEIQELVSPCDSKTTPTKTEKAEVLEKAVIFLHQNQQRHDRNNNSTPVCLPKGSDYFKQGFESCMSQVFSQLAQDEEVKEDLAGIQNHLDNFLQNIVSGHRENNQSDMPRNALDLSSKTVLLVKSDQSKPLFQTDKQRVDVTNEQNHFQQPSSYDMTSEWVSNQVKFMQQQQLMQQEQQQRQQLQQQPHQQVLQQQYIQQVYQQAINVNSHSDPGYSAFHGLQSVCANYLQDGASLKLSELKPLANSVSPNYLSIGSQNVSMKNISSSSPGIAGHVWRPW